MVQARLTVRVQPNARRNEIVSVDGNGAQIRVAAPPQQGKANAALIAYLAAVLDLSQRDIAILRGITSREKLLFIEGLDQEEVLRRLRHAAIGRRPGTKQAEATG